MTAEYTQRLRNLHSFPSSVAVVAVAVEPCAKHSVFFSFVIRSRLDRRIALAHSCVCDIFGVSECYWFFWAARAAHTRTDLGIVIQFSHRFRGGAACHQQRNCDLLAWSSRQTSVRELPEHSRFKTRSHQSTQTQPTHTSPSRDDRRRHKRLTNRV